MSTKTAGRYKLKAMFTNGSSVLPGQRFAVHVTHRDSRVQWMCMLPNVSSIGELDRLVETMELAEVERLIAMTKPIGDIPTVHLSPQEAEQVIRDATDPTPQGERKTN